MAQPVVQVSWFAAQAYCEVQGARLRYVPQMVQYHYVDNERLTLSYVARKGFQRSRSVTRVRSEHDAVPRYMWRKVATYGLQLAFSMNMQARRFYLVRLASALGQALVDLRQVRLGHAGEHVHPGAQDRPRSLPAKRRRRPVCGQACGRSSPRSRRRPDNA